MCVGWGGVCVCVCVFDLCCHGNDTQSLLLAKHGNKRNSKNEMLHVHHTWVDDV